MTPRAKPAGGLVFTALIAVQVLFGINYVVSKVIVGVFDPLVWASIRIVISSIVMVTAAVLLRSPMPKARSKFFKALIVWAFLGTFFNQACFLVGLKHTTSTNSAILNTLIPIFTLLFVTVRGKEPLTVRSLVGFLSAFCGVLVLRKIENFTWSDDTAFGDLLVILNCLSYSLFLAYGKEFVETHDRVWTTAWLFVYGSVGITLIAIPSFTQFSMPELTPGLLSCIVFAIFGGTILTYFLNNWALVYAKSSQVALFIYIQPMVASFLAWAYLDEEITARTIVSMVLIFLGVVLGLQGGARHGHAIARAKF